MERIETKENKFPNDLEGRLDAMLNVVNTEFKSLTLLHLDTEHALSKDELRSRMKKTLEGRGYLVERAALINYCSDVFYPIGAVAREETVNETGMHLQSRYKLSRAGLKYGLPIAAFSLNWVVLNKQSLFEVLGSTQSNSKSRSPINSANIMEKVIKSDKPIPECKIMEQLNLPQAVVVAGLKRLRKAELINFESIGKNSSQRGAIHYQYLQNDDPFPSIERTNKTLIQNVYDTLKKKGSGNYIEIAEHISETNPANVSRILNIFARNGYAKRLGSWNKHSMMSFALALEKGKHFVKSYLEPVREALSDEKWLEKMNKDYLIPLMEDPKHFQEVAAEASNIYARISPLLNSRSPDERFERILELVSKYGVCSSERVTKDMDLSKIRVRKLMNELVVKGKLSQGHNGDEKVYFIAGEER